MTPWTLQLVKCVACRELYRQGTARSCPHCGSPSWVAAWIARSPEPVAQAREM